MGIRLYPVLRYGITIEHYLGDVDAAAVTQFELYGYGKHSALAALRIDSQDYCGRIEVTGNKRLPAKASAVLIDVINEQVGVTDRQAKLIVGWTWS